MSALSRDVAVADSWWAMLRADVPAEVGGLWFGIFTARAGGLEQRTLYVAGTADFDPHDETFDWAAGEYVWQPARRYIVLPALAALPDRPYDVPLRHAVTVLREVAPWVDVPDVGVAVGYDDGDAELLYCPA